LLENNESIFGGEYYLLLSFFFVVSPAAAFIAQAERVACCIFISMCCKRAGRRAGRSQPAVAAARSAARQEEATVTETLTKHVDVEIVKVGLSSIALTAFYLVAKNCKKIVFQGVEFSCVKAVTFWSHFICFHFATWTLLYYINTWFNSRCAEMKSKMQQEVSK